MLDGARTVAVIEYDTALIADDRLLTSAGPLVALALERERLTAALIASHDALRRSRARIVEVADAERRSVAQNLHDLLQNRLVVCAMQADRFASDPATGEDLRVAAARLRDDLDEAITELRRQVQGVMPALLLEGGLAPAVEELTDRLPLPTQVEISDGVDPLTPTVASAAYFILAEALANVVKHARAGKVSVRLARADTVLSIEVQDDGVGGAATAAGAGLRGIGARAEALEGSLSVVSTPAKGTQLRVVLPCGS